MASDREKEHIIRKAKEPLLTMGFLKDDGSFRVMNFRLNVSGKKGGELRYIPKELGAILVYDMDCARKGGKKNKSCHRTIYLNRIAWIIADGDLYDFRKNRGSIPSSKNDLYTNKGKMQIDKGEDPAQKGVILTPPKNKKSNLYEVFKISNMNISFRKI